jgi:type II secretory pathway pseudopilin PulG
MKRTAFSMVELIFVIIVVGILAVLAMPNFERPMLAEGVEKMAAQIRYTQHLAMNEDQYDASDPKWREENWQYWFRIFNDKFYYEIFSDRDGEGYSDADEEAKDPQNPSLTLGNGVAGVGLPINKDLHMTEKYGITATDVLSGNCNMGQGFRVAFDSLGRPYANVTYDLNDPYNNIFTVPCVIRVTHGDSGKTADISIAPITGHVSVVYN